MDKLVDLGSNIMDTAQKHASFSSHSTQANIVKSLHTAEGTNQKRHFLSDVSTQVRG